MAFCKQLKLNTLHACRAQYLHFPGQQPNSLTDHSSTTQGARAVTGAREPSKEDPDLLFQLQHCKMLQANANSPFPQSKPSYQLCSFSRAPLLHLLWYKFIHYSTLSTGKQSSSPGATTLLPSFNRLCLEYQQRQKKLTGDKVLGSKVFWVFNRWHFKPVQCNIIQLFCRDLFLPIWFEKQAANRQCHLIQKHACGLGEAQSITKSKAHTHW